MKKAVFFLFGLLYLSSLIAQDDAKASTTRVSSTIDSSAINELVLIQEFDVKVPIQAVWEAYTTKQGWEGAFVALAEIDLKVGGTIKTSYDKNATIGDSSTIILHLINYVPQKLITLQAELSPHFPELIKKNEKDLYNVIYFEAIEDSLTRVTSYGIGYKNTPEFLSLMKFFIQGNEMSYLNLIKYLETGETAKY